MHRKAHGFCWRRSRCLVEVRLGPWALPHERAGTYAAPILTPDELGRVRQVHELRFRGEGEEADDDLTRALAAAAFTEQPRGVVERVQAVVDRDLLSRQDFAPSEHLHAVAHR